MNDTKLSRNDLCHCGSGKKYKKCCLEKEEALQRPSNTLHLDVRGRPAIAKPPPASISTILSDAPINAVATRGFARPTDEDNPPPANTVQLLPVEVHLDYTYREPYGMAEVGYIFPGGRLFLLENGQAIVNDNLKPGMKIQLRGGRLALITKVELTYEPPDPPKATENGLTLSRIIGTVKHHGNVVMDVSWQGYTATCTPDHRYYSVSKQTYVPAISLRPGELLRTPEGATVPVLAVSRPRRGVVDLYNVEVEGNHNYFVGGSAGASVLVHNGIFCGDTPIDLGEAEVQAMLSADRLSINTAREMGIQAPPDHHIFPQSESAWFEDRGVNVDDFTVTLDQATHEAIHYGGGPGTGGGWWNDTLMQNLNIREAAAGRTLTPAEIMEEGQAMLQRANLDDLPVHPWNSTK